MSFECRGCGNASGNAEHIAREMMFGTRDEFVYCECAKCGTLQIKEIPELAKYYPDNYLSFNSETPVGRTAIHRFAARAIGQYFVEGRGFAGKLLSRKRPGFAGNFPAALRDPELGLTFDSRMLDFGCGKGQLLQTLHYFGFRDLTGADAFIEGDIELPTAVRILKRPLSELEPAFDLIIMSHSFEHLPDPKAALRDAFRLLRPGGHLLISMPVINFAWEKYGTDWVQLDAPRHLYLFTERAFVDLANDARFSVASVRYESTTFQFWGSEMYRKDIQLIPEGAPGVIHPPDIFTDAQMAEWEREAARLNAEGRGDTATFILKRPE